MLGADQPALLRGGGVRQHRRQRLAGHRHPRPQILGLLDAPVRLLCGDPQQRRQRRPQRRLPQLLQRHLGQGADHTVVHRRAAPLEPLPVKRHRRTLRRRPVHRLSQRRLQLKGHHGDALGSGHRTHTSNTSSNHRHLDWVRARGRSNHRLEPAGFLIFEWPSASTTCAVLVSLFGNLEPADVGLLLTECLGHAGPDRRSKPD